MSRIDQILQNDTSRWNGYYDVNGNQALTDSLNPYYNNNTDWQGNYYRRTVNQTYNLSVKGGSTKFNYKINGNYYSKKVLSPIRTSTVTESVPIWVMRLRRSSICMSGSMQRWVLRDPEVETRCSRPVWPVELLLLLCCRLRPYIVLRMRL